MRRWILRWWSYVISVGGIVYWTGGSIWKTIGFWNIYTIVGIAFFLKRLRSYTVVTKRSIDEIPTIPIAIIKITSCIDNLLKEETFRSNLLFEYFINYLEIIWYITFSNNTICFQKISATFYLFTYISFQFKDYQKFHLDIYQRDSEIIIIPILQIEYNYILDIGT